MNVKEHIDSSIKITNKAKISISFELVMKQHQL